MLWRNLSILHTFQSLKGFQVMFSVCGILWFLYSDHKTEA